MSQAPLVSVLMNCFNGEKYLRDAIESVLAQTYQNWEIIFWDNQSIDKSADIFKSYSDSRLKYFYAPRHTWLYEARNCAIDKASGEFVAFLDVDDSWLPTKLELQIPLFKDPEVGFVCSNYWLNNEKKKRQWEALNGDIPTGWVLNDLLKNYFVGLLTLIVRREAITSLEYPCNPRFHVMGDLDLVVRLSIKWKLDCVQVKTAICRKHDGNETIKHRSRHLAELEYWIDEMGRNDEIVSCQNFDFMKKNYIYQKAIYMILQHNRREAFLISNELPWGKLKIKLWIILLLPLMYIYKLRND